MKHALEACLFFRYFSTEVGDEEWRARLNIMQLCDCTLRIKMFQQFKNLEQVQGFEPQAADLRKKIRENPYFQSLESKLQTQLLGGFRPSIFSLRQLSEMYQPDQRVWGLYELLSNHTHSQPLSFYRTVEQKRTGVESGIERSYIALSLHMSAEELKHCLDSYESDFAKLVQLKEPPAELDPLNFPAHQAPRRGTVLPGRNSQCPCGSGKKYKHCHGV
jgi:hypothetical protein